MKKIISALSILALVVPSVFAASPTEEEVAIATQAVFGVYGAVFMSNLMGNPVPGAKVDMNMETGASSITFTNVDAVTLFSTLGQAISDADEVIEPPFSHLSGSFTADADGNMKMNFTMKGGTVKTLSMIINNEEVVEYKANGKDFRYLSDTLEFGQ